jgi:hypothetical protein
MPDSFRRLYAVRRKAMVVLLLMAGGAQAHIKNEATQFPDIEFSAARFDIVVLVGAGIIPETPVFEPDKALSMSELATWGALAHGLKHGSETPDVAALAELALQDGLVSTLDGDASLADVNRVLFAGELLLDDGTRVPSKAEAASLIAAELDSAAGLRLLESRGLVVTAGGEVLAVTTETGHHGNTYVITVGGTTHAMDAHGRVANGPTDLLQWEGRTIRRAFLRGSGEHAVWTYLEAAPREAAVVAQAASVVDETATAGDGAAAEPDRRILLGLVIAVVLLGAALFARRRRSRG